MDRLDLVTDHPFMPLTRAGFQCGHPHEGEPQKACLRRKEDHSHSAQTPRLLAPDPRPVHATDTIPAVQAWDAFSAQVRDTIVRKSVGYGNAWQAQGYMGNLARVLSKAARMQNMLWRDDPSNGIGASVGGESVADTAVDGAALLAFLLANFEDGNRWGR